MGYIHLGNEYTSDIETLKNAGIKRITTYLDEYGVTYYKCASNQHNKNALRQLGYHSYFTVKRSYSKYTSMFVLTGYEYGL